MAWFAEAETRQRASEIRQLWFKSSYGTLWNVKYVRPLSVDVDEYNSVLLMKVLDLEE